MIQKESEKLKKNRKGCFTQSLRYERRVYKGRSQSIKTSLYKPLDLIQKRNKVLKIMKVRKMCESDIK